MAENYDVRFSEDSYATKEQVGEAFNVSNVDFIWNQIISYRKKHTVTFDLHSIDMTKFSLVMTNSITNRILSFERSLNKVFFDYNYLNDFAKKAFKERRLVKILSKVSSFSGSEEAGESFLKTLIENSISTIPSDSIVVDNYLNALRYIETHDAGAVSYVDYNSLNQIINSGEEDKEASKEKAYRTNDYDEPHYYQKGYVYNAALSDRIDSMMDDLSLFINDSSEFASVRGISALFYSYYVMPYELFREMNSCLIFKEGLAKAGFGAFASFLNIEGLMLTKDKGLLSAYETVQKTFDLTYFFDYVFKYLNLDIKDMMDDMALSQKDTVSYENRGGQIDDNPSSQVNESIHMMEAEPENLGMPGDDNNKSVVNNLLSTPLTNEVKTAPAPTDNVQIYGKPDVALPIFPTGLKGEDVDRIAVDLRETFPTLSKSQAHFYASHCTIGRSYTIQEFKSSESTSYETARTSMDYLAQMGFFEKTKIRNKFVYKPIPRRNSKA